MWVKQQCAVAFMYLACQTMYSLCLCLFSFVYFYREGSVIADMEITFEESVGTSEVDALLTEATRDKKMGDLEVIQVQTGGFIKSQLLL